MQLFYARTTASQNQDFFTLIHFKRWFFFFSEQKKTKQTGMWWINDQLSPRWSNVSRPKLWLYGKWLLHFSSKCLCSSAGCRQLGGTTWRSVGSAHSFASASLGCGTPCGRTLWRCRGTWRLLVKKKKNTECKWWKMIRVRSDSSRRRKRKRKKKSLTWFFWTVKTSFIWNLWAEELWVRKRPRWKERRHREASLFQLSGFWAFTFLVAMVTAESTDTTKAVEVFCVPWELPGPAN